MFSFCVIMLMRITDKEHDRSFQCNYFALCSLIRTFAENYQLMGTDMMNEKKKYEECRSFQECVDELVRRTIIRIEEEVSDKGSFSDIFELFDNPNADTTDVVGKFGLHVYKMPSDIVADPAMRYVQACAYIPSGAYKATLMAGSGRKAEILELMKEQSFADKLSRTFDELTDMLRDI